MTSKTIKTLLFASLIAAMILPFNSMDFAHAQEETTQEQIAKIQKYKDELQSSKTSDSEETQIVIDRLDMVEELLVVKELAADGTVNQEYANRITTFLLKQIDKTFTEEAVPIIKGEAPQAARSTTTNFQTNTQTLFNCDDIANDSGYNWGTITPVDLLESYVVGAQGFPSHIDTLTNNFCTEKSFDDGYVKWRNTATGGLCTGDLPNSNSVDQGYCSKFGAGAPVLITAFAWYDGSIPFNATESWTFLWVP